MNRRRIENIWFKEALRVVGNTKKVFIDGDKIEKASNGYAAAFCPTVIQAGLINALEFYTKDSKDEKVKRDVFYTMLKYLINESKDLKETANDLKAKSMKQFLEYRTRVMEAAIALKLAMRTYPEFEEKSK